MIEDVIVDTIFRDYDWKHVMCQVNFLFDHHQQQLLSRICRLHLSVWLWFWWSHGYYEDFIENPCPETKKEVSPLMTLLRGANIEDTTWYIFFVLSQLYNIVSLNNIYEASNKQNKIKPKTSLSYLSLRL